MERHEFAEASPGRARTWSIVGLIVLVVLVAIARVQRTIADPNFDARDATGLVKSDPGLIYYLVERVVESNGSIPVDWSADPRIEHPGAYDVPGHLPVAQEFVVAWLRLALGDALPLHVFCLWVAGAFASLALVGVWLLAGELSGDSRVGFLAALFAALMPASWRTMGFILMDEDFSLPFFALHLGFLARAARVRTQPSMLLASLALAAAVSTWHATSFLFALEAAAIAGACLVRSANPLRERWTWSLPIVLVATGACVPFLRHAGFVTSAGVLLVLAAWAEAILGRRLFPRAGLRTLLASAIVLVGIAGVFVARGSSGDHEHVFALLAAKVEFFGVRPADPLALAPDVRLMWQGPFETLEPSVAWTMLGTGLVVAVLALVTTLRGTADARLFATAIGACFALTAAVLVSRVVVLPALILPAIGVPLARTVLRRAPALWAVVALVVAQAFAFVAWFEHYDNPWYASPPQRREELRELIRALPALVPEDEAVAADSINSTAVLAHTKRRAILSPKWESSASRARVVEFITAFHTLSPADFRALLVTKYRCRYLLVDRVVLGYLCAYTAGLRGVDPRPGSAASVFLARDQEILTSVSGYRLLYRSPARIVQSNGTPSDYFRLYALEYDAAGK